MATKLLLTDLASSVSHVPSNYIRPIFDRPNLSDVVQISDASIPLIDLQGLHGPRHSHIIERIAQACQHHGFFQVKNHGISESLGLQKDYIGKALGKHGQHMALNYFPPCPQPELTYGLPGHTDPNLIIVLLQDDVPGLQVLRNGKWIAVNPIPNTFIVNIGDQMQGRMRKVFILALRENALVVDAIYACSTRNMPTEGCSRYSTSEACWILDSGASCHMTCDSSLLSRSRSYSAPITVANGVRMEAKEIGSIDSPSLSVHDVLFVPGLALNLLSVAQICGAGYGIYFCSAGFVVRDQSKKIVGSGSSRNGLYVVERLHIPPSDISFPEPSSPGPSVSLSYVPNTTTFASQDVDIVSFESADPVRLQFNASSSEIKATMKEEFDTEDYVVSSGFIGDVQEFDIVRSSIFYDANFGIALDENFVKRLP